jgi:hypothetical protein
MTFLRRGHEGRASLGVSDGNSRREYRLQLRRVAVVTTTPSDGNTTIVTPKLTPLAGTAVSSRLTSSKWFDEDAYCMRVKSTRTESEMSICRKFRVCLQN